MSMSGNPFGGSSANAGGSYGGGMGGGLPDGLFQLLSGLFGNSGRPFGEAQRAYDEHTAPWINAGRNAINPFTQRVNEMGNGGDFMKGIMSDYQESPFARYQQQQGIRAANASGSASGLAGSTPMQQFAQQNAQNISSGDMQNYFNNRMGINKDYLSGQNQLMNYGSNFDANAAPWAGDVAGGKAYGQNQDRMNVMQGGSDIAAKVIQMLLMG